MGVFDFLKNKKSSDHQKTDIGVESTDSLNSTQHIGVQSTSTKCEIEELLARENPYSEHIAFKILDALFHTEIYQFTENPVEGEKVKILFSAIPITVKGITTRWLAVFTNTDSMSRCKAEPFFSCKSKCFQMVCDEAVLKDEIAGIILNPYVHNYTIPKETLRKWKVITPNNDRLLKLIQAQMESPDAEQAGAYFDIIIHLRKAYLPIPITIQEDGSKSLCLYKANFEDQAWLAVFTNTDTLEDSMQKNGGKYNAVEYYAGMFDKIAQSAIRMNCNGIVVNPDSHGFKIDSETLKIVIQS